MVATLSESEPSWEHARTWDELVEVVTQMETSASEAGELAMRDVCRLLKERLQVLKKTSAEPTHLHRALLRYGSRLMRAYLEGTHRSDAIDVLVTVLQHPAWVNPLNDSEAKLLRKLLNAPPPLDRASPAHDPGDIAPARDRDARSSSEHSVDFSGSTATDVRSGDPEDDGSIDEQPCAAFETGEPTRGQETDVSELAGDADASGEADAAADDVTATSDADEVDADSACVDYTMEPDDPLDQTLNVLPGVERDADVDLADEAFEPTDPREQTPDALPSTKNDADPASVDDTTEPDDPFDQTLNPLPSAENDADPASVDDTTEPDDPLDQTLDALPSAENEADPPPPDDTTEANDPLDSTVDALPSVENEADPPSPDDTTEPDDPFDRTLDALPDEEVDAGAEFTEDTAEPTDARVQSFDAFASEDTEASSDPGDEPVPPGATESDAAAGDAEVVAPEASLENSGDLGFPVETTHEAPAEDDEDLAADLIRELRDTKAARERTHESAPASAGDPGGSAPLADEPTRSTAFAEEFEDPEHVEADLEALYSGDSRIDEAFIDPADGYGREDPPPAADGLADTDEERSGADAVPGANVDSRDDDSALDTLTDALGGLAEEYGEAFAAPTDKPPGDEESPLSASSDESETHRAQTLDTARQAPDDPSGETPWNDDAWSAALGEMMQLLMASFTEVHTSITECVRIAAREDVPTEERRAAITRACEQLEGFEGAMKVIGSARLSVLYERIRENLGALRSRVVR